MYFECSYSFVTIKNELSVFENPYLDPKIVFLSHLEAEIWKNLVFAKCTCTEINFFRQSKYSYRFLTIINELSEFENPYLDLKIVFLSHLEAEILKT